ncbi:hypothetical protein Dimus_004495 [Dionaea muscipula]
MMKPVSESTCSHGTNHSWLGFSLSPHMNMEVSSDHPNHHQYHHSYHRQQAQAATCTAGAGTASLGVPDHSVHPASMFLSPQQQQQQQQLHCSGVCFRGGENDLFHPQLTIMPLKSDGALCIMEALSISHSQGLMPNSSSVPKLENFLGSAAMGSHLYGSHEREAMAPLRLDSIYYPQNADQESYFSADGCHGMYLDSFDTDQTKETSLQIAECNNAQMTSQLQVEDGIPVPVFKNWVSRSCYSAHHPHPHPLEQEQQQMDAGAMVENGGGGGGGGGSSGPTVTVMGCGDLKSLSLSMSPGSQSSCVTATPPQIPASGTGTTGGTCGLAMETKKRGPGKSSQKQTVHRKSIDTFGQRTSQYRGVTKHRWTGRYEAHLWDNSCKKEGQTRKGRQVYLGGYDMEEKAARAYDLAALKYWGASTHINFPLENYKDELEEMRNMTRQEYVAHLRRNSSGFSRGASMYRGVTRHHQHGRWQARIGRVAGNKDLYLGTYSTQEEAAEAYDVAAIRFRGGSAVTNFDIARYDVEKITASNTLLVGEEAKRLKITTTAADDDLQEEVENKYKYNNVNHSSSSVQQYCGEACCSGYAANYSNGNSFSDWKKKKKKTMTTTILYHDQSPHTPNPCLELDSLCSLKPMGVGSYQICPPFSIGDHDLDQDDDDDDVHDHHQSTKLPARGSIQYLSNSSSLVTSLNSSREGSPEKGGDGGGCSSDPSIQQRYHKLPFMGWNPSSMVPIRPSHAPTMTHLPVFAAWSGDA